MNLVGKILTVLILVMAVFFSALAVLNYAAKRNWMLVVTNPKATADMPLGLKYRLEDQLEENQKLRDQLTALKGQLERERQFALQARAKLETANQILATQNKQLQADLDQKTTQLNEAVADVKVTHEALARLRNEVDTLRADIRTAQKDKENHFKEVVRLTADLHNTANELSRVREINRSVSEDLAKAKTWPRPWRCCASSGSSPSRNSTRASRLRSMAWCWRCCAMDWSRFPLVPTTGCWWATSWTCIGPSGE